MYEKTFQLSSHTPRIQFNVLSRTMEYSFVKKGVYINQYTKPIVEEKVYYSLIPKGSVLGKMYGFAKNNKNTFSLSQYFQLLTKRSTKSANGWKPT